jgi:hypothetical protein
MNPLFVSLADGRRCRECVLTPRMAALAGRKPWRRIFVLRVAVGTAYRVSPCSCPRWIGSGSIVERGSATRRRMGTGRALALAETGVVKGGAVALPHGGACTMLSFESCPTGRPIPASGSPSWRRRGVLYGEQKPAHVERAPNFFVVGKLPCARLMQSNYHSKVIDCAGCPARG